MTSWIERLLGETQARVLLLLRRARQTVAGLAGELGLTDNAVRTHLATLQRHGMVAQVGTQRDTGGKPAWVYDLTREGEELFPKAYALVLGELVDEVQRSEGRDRLISLLRAVGARVAGNASAETGDVEQRVEAAAVTLRRLGADARVQQTGPGWRIQGQGCPLSAVTASRREVCELARTIVAQITQRPVTECCDRSDRPRCAFEVDR